MRTNLRYFFIFAVSMLACSVSTSAENALSVNKDTHINSKASTDVNTVEMVVTGSLNIRADHSENSADIGDLFEGQIVTCELPMTVVAESIWCKHEFGWSNTRWLEAK